MYIANDTILLVLYLFIMTVVVIIFLYDINHLLGGFDCKICTKVHFNGYITNWSISHFITFLVAGFISPRNFYLIVIAGVVWEFLELFFEYTSRRNHDSILCKIKILRCEEELNSQDFWNHYFGIKEHKHTQYTWSSGGMLGSIMDIIVNTLGVYTGIYLRKLLYK